MSRPKTCEECERENEEALSVLETGVRYALLSDIDLGHDILERYGFNGCNWNLAKAVAVAYRAGYIIGIRTERRKKQQKATKINEI